MADVTITGVKELKAMLLKSSEDLQKIVEEQLDKSAKDTADLLYTKVPYDASQPVHLRDTIVITNGKRKLSRWVAIGNAEAPYGWALEKGHITKEGAHVPPHPFFMPVYRYMTKLTRSRTRRAINKYVKQYMGAHVDGG